MASQNDPHMVLMTDTSVSLTWNPYSPAMNWVSPPSKITNGKKIVGESSFPHQFAIQDAVMNVEPADPARPSAAGGVIGLKQISRLQWSITAIEWTIATNDIQGVNDISATGQLIPFVIGVFSLPTTAWGIFKNHREEAHKSNAQKDDSELDTPLKHLSFADAGLASPNGVYTAIKPRPNEQRDDFDLRPGSSEMREARTFWVSL
ncbi:uncharacterized protein PAC_00632 [Phialocephala subalpina]|uniref:Uncharacterized protein n=1 Tax=Phialocephala subalpina TaxID=576137 RepID=A0A1L7WDG1_9HELO|nr:uncharacterized protein PAC_00632 [Phialocephala subalpina]